MAKKFLAVLGNGNNSNCIYTYKNKQLSTCYVQEAIVDMMCSEWGSNDKFVVFLTDDARNKNWEGENKLKERIIKSNPNIQIIEKSIEDGSNEEEISKVFGTMYDAIDDDDEIIFDITNAFRYLPMMTLTVLNFAREIKNTKVQGIYYGKFKRENEIAPIIDMTDLYRMVSLTNKLKDIKRNSEVIEEDVDFMDFYNNLDHTYKYQVDEAAATL